MIANEELIFKLKESEEKFKNLVEATSDWVWECDKEGLYVYVSPRIKDLLGYEASEVLGKTPFDFMPEGERTRIGEIFKEKVAKKEAFHGLENTNRHKDGHLVILETSAVPVFDEEGRLKGYRGMDRDITERKKAEEILRVNQEKYRALLESASDQIFMFNEEYKAISMNSAASILYGKKPDEMIGKHISEIFTKEMASRNIKNLEIVFKTGRNYSIEEELNFGANKLYVSTSLSPVKNSEGKTTAVLGVVRDITEHKKMEEALRDSEGKFKVLLESAPDALFMYDPKGVFVDGNAAAEKLVGYKREELIGKSFLKIGLISSGQFLKAAADLAKNVMGLSAEAREYILKRKDGTKVCVEINSHPIKIKGQTLILGIARDVTERKKAEMQLKESEEKFRLLFESSRDALMTLEPPSWAFTSGNPATLKMFNAKSVKEFVSFSPGELSPERQPDGRASVEKAGEMIEVAMREGSHFFAWTHRRIDGGDFPATVLLTRMELSGKRFLQATVRDITESMNAESLLRESEEKFKAIFESANDGFLLASLKDKKFILGNKAICGMTGYTPEEIKALGLMDIHPEKDLPYVIDQFEKQARKELRVAENLPVKRKDGSVFYADINSSTLTVSGETCLMGVFRDVTERRAAEALRDELLRKVEQANRNTTQFVSDVSHELRNPLASIKGFVSTIRSDPAMDEPTRLDFLRIAEEETDRLTRIIDDLLDISRVESGRLKLTMRSFNIIDLIMKGIVNLKMLAESREINIKSELPSSQDIVYADEDKTLQVITNLLSNAIKYNKKGGKVIISALQENGRVRVNVEDSGIGIADKDIPRIFDKFFRADEAAAQAQGAGLGLSVTKGLVESMGGELAFKSNHGEGSNFSFTLPRAVGN